MKKVRFVLSIAIVVAAVLYCNTSTYAAYSKPADILSSGNLSSTNSTEDDPSDDFDYFCCQDIYYLYELCK